MVQASLLRRLAEGMVQRRAFKWFFGHCGGLCKCSSLSLDRTQASRRLSLFSGIAGLEKGLGRLGAQRLAVLGSLWAQAKQFGSEPIKY